MSSTDKVKQQGKWKFDKEVAESFDDMLERTIPMYNVMRQTVSHLGALHIQKNTDVVDLGCSRGGAIIDLVKMMEKQKNIEVFFRGYEISDPMLEIATKRFKSYKNVIIEKFDLRNGFPNVRASLIICNLTLMFIPLEHRQRVVQDIYNHLVPGGGLLLVEKVLGNDNIINKRLVYVHELHKKQNGYSIDDIERKKINLEGVLMPLSSKWNEELLSHSGFRHIDCFWRHMNFTGWLAVK